MLDPFRRRGRPTPRRVRRPPWPSQTWEPAATWPGPTTVGHCGLNCTTPFSRQTRPTRPLDCKIHTVPRPNNRILYGWPTAQSLSVRMPRATVVHVGRRHRLSNGLRPWLEGRRGQQTRSRIKFVWSDVVVVQSLTPTTSKLDGSLAPPSPSQLFAPWPHTLLLTRCRAERARRTIRRQRLGTEQKHNPTSKVGSVSQTKSR